LSRKHLLYNGDDFFPTGCLAHEAGRATLQQSTYQERVFHGGQDQDRGLGELRAQPGNQIVTVGFGHVVIEKNQIAVWVGCCRGNDGCAIDSLNDAQARKGLLESIPESFPDELVVVRNKELQSASPYFLAILV